MEKLKDRKRPSICSSKNDLVQSYLNTLDEALPPDTVDDQPYEMEPLQQRPRLPPKTFPRPIEPVYENVLPSTGDSGFVADNIPWYYDSPPKKMDPMTYEPIHPVYEPRRRYSQPREDFMRRPVTVRHIVMPPSPVDDYYSRRTKSSLDCHRRQLPQRPLERHRSQPNLQDGSRRQLPKTPDEPPGTIIVIEKLVPDRRPRPPLRRCDSNAERRIRTAFISENKRSCSLPRTPRRRYTATQEPSPPNQGVYMSRRSRKSLPTVTGTGRRLPPTPHQASLLLHHTPNMLRKRELPSQPRTGNGSLV